MEGEVRAVRSEGVGMRGWSVLKGRRVRVCVRSRVSGVGAL
jgi:hypothetical protein